MGLPNTHTSNKLSGVASSCGSHGNNNDRVAGKRFISHQPSPNDTFSFKYKNPVNLRYLEVDIAQVQYHERFQPLSRRFLRLLYNIRILRTMTQWGCPLKSPPRHPGQIRILVYRTGNAGRPGYCKFHQPLQLPSLTMLAVNPTAGQVLRRFWLSGW